MRQRNNPNRCEDEGDARFPLCAASDPVMRQIRERYGEIADEVQIPHRRELFRQRCAPSIMGAANLGKQRYALYKDNRGWRMTRIYKRAIARQSERSAVQ